MTIKGVTTYYFDGDARRRRDTLDLMLRRRIELMVEVIDGNRLYDRRMELNQVSIYFRKTLNV